MRSILSTLAIAGLGLLGAACGKDSHAATHAGEDPAKGAAATADCGHSVCGSNFFVDARSAGACAVGQTCSVTLTLVATGEFHINDEYPYKFKADDAAGVQFLGTDTAGKNVFSKVASNWRKTDEKTGVMTAAFQPADKTAKTISGTFKLSVCSAQNCQLEQQQVSTTVAVH